MGLSLEKGRSISLEKTAPRLTEALLGLGWDAQGYDGSPIDLDASAFLLNKDRKVRSNDDFVFYNQLGDVTFPPAREGDTAHFDPARASVMHQGDNRTGEGDGDDEQIVVNLARVPADVEAIVFVVTIHDAESRRQNFGQVRNAFIRLVDNKTGEEVAHYNLTEEGGVATALLFAELYRYNGDWKFRAVGEGFESGLMGFINSYGVQL